MESDTRGARRGILDFEAVKARMDKMFSLYAIADSSESTHSISTFPWKFSFFRSVLIPSS